MWLLLVLSLMRLILSLLVFLALPASGKLISQGRYHFNRLTVEDGLNDGLVTAICQDRYGYLWFASLGGLNRFDGYVFRFYGHIAGDTSSPHASIVESMALGPDGRLWIGFETGLMEYNYALDAFQPIHAVGPHRINHIYPHHNGELYLATSAGLIRYHTERNTAVHYRELRDSARAVPLGIRIHVMSAAGNTLYLVNGRNLLSLDLQTDELITMDVPSCGGCAFRSVTRDTLGRLWLAVRGAAQVIRFDPASRELRNYGRFLSPESEATLTNVNGIFCDRMGRIWMITAMDGLLEYAEAADTFEQYLHDPDIPASPGLDLYRSIFQDRDGMIWLGGNHGLNFFHPGASLFDVMMPFGDSLDIRNRRIARGVCEDAQGRYWFTTLDGLTRYHPASRSYTVWRNSGKDTPVVYYNSIRGVYADRNDDIWVATGAGVNVYRNRVGYMEFIPHENLPRGFYFSVNADRSGRIWFGTRDYESFYWFDPQDNTFHSISEHPYLKAFAGLGGRFVLEDSRGRYWLGLNGNGLGMYDPQANAISRWSTGDTLGNVIAGNIVVDIKEDHDGVIWVSTLSGISGIDTDRDTVMTFQRANGLLSNTASALGVDAYNRLWIATTRGVCMLDSTRSHFTAFGIRDGLPALEFPEHPGYVARNGDFIFPSNHGYVRFNPLRYKPEQPTLHCMLTGVNVAGAPRPASDIASLYFRSDQNAFALQFVALYYTNPGSVWYAYQLEGFDPEWKMTQQREVNYTNVPGGTYRFLIRATTHTGRWDDAPVLEVKVRVGTVFYKTWWFVSLCIVLALMMLYVVFRYRLQQQRQLLELSNKSQRLEKEKTLVMYESLKQQLNPHFLFNSLTSLRSLIRARSDEAGTFLDGLSRTYRYILKNRDQVTVPLGDEVKFAETYVQLQRARFPHGFEVRFAVGEDDFHRKIVPVTIQNLIENAIKHNLIDPDSPLYIDVFVEANALVVRNTLQRKEFVKTSNKQGLDNLRSLYQYMTDVPIKVIEGDQFFTVKIPLL